MLALCFVGRDPWAVAVTNMRPEDPGGPPLATFYTSVVRVGDRGLAFAAGSGRAAMLERDFSLLEHLAGRHPARPIDYLNVPGAMNRRVATSGRQGAVLISPSCEANYMPPSVMGGVGQVHGDENLLLDTHSMLLWGIDTIEMMAEVEARMRAMVADGELRPVGEDDEEPQPGLP